MSYFKSKIIIRSYVNDETGRKIKKIIKSIGPIYFNEKKLGNVYKKMISNEEFQNCEERIGLMQNADFKIEINVISKEKYDHYIKKISKVKQKEKLRKQKTKLKKQKNKVNRQKIRIKKQKEKLKKQKEKLKNQKIKLLRQKDKVKKQKMKVRKYK